ncbi:hypothetical protein T08_13544 [Trichinella sp. T8]|nr:hypothetical protein T08_13544 [Trichinella sp. T8]
MTIRFRSDSLTSNIGATANDQSRTCRLGKQCRYGLDKGHPTARLSILKEMINR